MTTGPSVNTLPGIARNLSEEILLLHQQTHHPISLANIIKQEALHFRTALVLCLASLQYYLCTNLLSLCDSRPFLSACLSNLSSGMAMSFPNKGKGVLSQLENTRE